MSKLHPYFVALCVVSCIASAVPVSAGKPTTATRQLLDAKPQLRAMFKGDRLIALYGEPLATNTVTVPPRSTDQFIIDFLADDGDQLGIDGLEYALKSIHVIHAGKFTVYTYTQEIESLPVHDSLIKLLVLMDTPQLLTYAGMRLVPVPASALPSDRLSDNDALNKVKQSADYGYLTTFNTPVRVVYQASDDSVHRAWRFAGWDDDEAYLFLVDTRNGAILGVHNQRAGADVNQPVHVQGFGTPGTVSDNPDPMPTPPDDRCPVEFDMPNIRVDVVGGGFEYADENGTATFTLPDDVQVEFQTTLVGEWGTITDLGSV